MRFMLWLKGLSIDYLVTRSGKPTDNAEVERCHRTLNHYVIRGQEHLGAAPLEAALDQAVHDLAYELPSPAAGCCGQSPVEVHPELLQPRRPYRPEHELVLFDLKRVDTYLATFTWKYTVSKNGEVSIGESYYYPGYKHRSQEVVVRFEPVTRDFVLLKQGARRDPRPLPGQGTGCHRSDRIRAMARWPRRARTSNRAPEIDT